MIDTLTIPSPKRRPSREDFQQVYPYYAGFPETFARALLSSSLVKPGSLVFDPWNGSGTTTAVASRLGLPALGFDLNPVMVIVAKARLLPASEGSSLHPLARAVLKQARASRFKMSPEDPLLLWFKPKTALALRAIERSCRELLVQKSVSWKIEELSSIAATFYTALFSTGRRMATNFLTANPTWMRLPKNLSERPDFPRQAIEERFLSAIETSRIIAGPRGSFQQISCEVSVKDATLSAPAHAVDCVLTSPPYCTRIDYTASTRIELALIHPLAPVDADTLRRGMVGTTMVPQKPIPVREEWGDKCIRFLDAVYQHPSKASKGYYHTTHLDYFDKMFKSIANLSSCLKVNGTAILVVQDSYYKNVHNDLPSIISEMADKCNLALRRRADFMSTNCMSRINSRAIAHSTRMGSTESVLIFAKHAN